MKFNTSFKVEKSKQKWHVFLNNANSENYAIIFQFNGNEGLDVDLIQKQMYE